MQIMEIAELDKKRMRIVLEDRSSFALYKGEARQYGLQQGEELSEELFEEICEKVLVKRARKRAVATHGPDRGPDQNEACAWIISR